MDSSSCFQCISILSLVSIFLIPTTDSLTMTKLSAPPNRINVFNFEPNPDPPKLLVCYYNTPHYTDSPFPLFPEQIPPDLCTHLIVAFAQVLVHNGSFTLGPGDPRDLEFWKRTVQLKQMNPKLQVLLSVAGSNGPNETITQMMGTESSRADFIKNAIRVLELNDFDGLDVDWEFPREQEQKAQFIRFLSEFRSQIGDPSPQTLLLSAALGAEKTDIDVCYWDPNPQAGIPALANSLDFANIMTYDYHYYSWMSPMTGPNAPLYNTSGDFGYMLTENGAWSLAYWAELGMPREKILMGVPLYGRTFELVDEKSHDYYSLAMGPGMGGPGGYLSYPDICKFLARNQTSFVFNDGSREAYAWNHRDWVSFDVERSVEDKAAHAISKELAGIMVYSLNSEDAWKLCQNPDPASPPFPRVQKIKHVLFP